MSRLIHLLARYLLVSLLLICAPTSLGQSTRPAITTQPDPHEIPLPVIETDQPALPGVDALPEEPAMPDLMLLRDGTRVTTPAQWQRRRQEIRQILEYYATGYAPPPPGNVTGQVLKMQVLRGGDVEYRLVHLTFGPRQMLSLNIGIFTPIGGGPFPVVISTGPTPPGAAELPRLPMGPTQGQNADALLSVGGARNSPRRIEPRLLADPEAIAGNPVLRHGFAFVIFNNNDCGEDTTLRNADGSWAYRTTRFFPAYPHYDWGLLRCWAWGVSRIVDYLQTDPSIDATKIIVTGVSRTGKSALIAGAFDDRIATVAPVASSGGGTPAFRFSGVERGGNEGLSEMMRKYPNWFSPHLHQFWGHVDKLPFDEHFFIALCAPRPFIALEGLHDQNVNVNAVRQSFLAARPAYELLNVGDRLGINWADRPHGLAPSDWDALLTFADKFLLNKPVKRSFDRFVYDVRAAGALADGKTPATAEFQAALDACGKDGGGYVRVPPGEYLIGSIEIPSSTTLLLEKGATLLGSANLADYPITKVRWEGRWVDGHRGLVFADGASHIAIDGPGRVIGSPKLGGREMPRRPCVIELLRCRDVLLRDFSTQQQRMWTIHPTLCQDVSVRNLTIRSTGGNGDGIDLDSCRNVNISYCDFETGDDCIALKSGRGMDAYKAAEPTEHVAISNCKLGDNIFADIGIGSETSGGIHDVTISDCLFTHANTYCIYIKSHIGRGASIDNISATNLVVQNATKGFLRINLISSGRTDADPVPGAQGVPAGKNFSFANVKLADCRTLVDAFEISPEKPLDGFSLSDISGECERGMILANMKNVAIRRIMARISKGPMLAVANVSGAGLQGAARYIPSTAPSTRRATTRPADTGD